MFIYHLLISVPYLSSIYPSIIYLPTSLSTYDLAIYQHVSNSLISGLPLVREVSLI